MAKDDWNKTRYRGVDKLIRANELKSSIYGKGQGSGWRGKEKLSNTLKSRITLARTTMEKKMKLERELLHREKIEKEHVK